MLANLMKSLLLDMTTVLAPLSAAMLCYLWLRQKDTDEMLKAVQNIGLHFSRYESVYAGPLQDFFDADLFLGDPKHLDRVVRWFKEELETQRELGITIDRLAFIEKREGPVGALTLKDLLSHETGVPVAILRPRRRGPAPRIKGLSRDSQPLSRFDEGGVQEHVAILSDTGTTGTTILEAVDMVEKAGGKVDVAFVLYDRAEGASEALKAHSVRLLAMAGPEQLKAAVPALAAGAVHG